MPRDTLRSLKADIETLRKLRIDDEAVIRDKAKEIAMITKRIADISAENESLRMDKKWLQQMHSGLLQSIPELLLRSRNALSR